MTRKDVSVVNPDGSVSIAEVLRLSWYMRAPNLSMVDSVATAIRRFCKLVGFRSLSTYYDFEGEQVDLDATSLEEIIEARLLGPHRFENATVQLVDNGLHAPTYSLYYYGTAASNPEVPDEASFLDCFVPRSLFGVRADELIQFFTDTCVKLPISSAYASLALSGEDMRRKQGFAARHPGLDIANPSCVARGLAGKCAGVYWQTVTGVELSARLGGVSEIARAAPPSARVDELAPGVCRIVFSSEPDIGDVNHNQRLPEYRVFARWLDARSELHIPQRPVYFVDAQGNADEGAMEAWHRRFLV